MIVYEETYQDLKNLSSMVYRTLATRKTKASFLFRKSSARVDDYKSINADGSSCTNPLGNAVFDTRLIEHKFWYKPPHVNKIRK